MIDLPHVAARVFGTPLLIARGKLDIILGVLAPRLTGGALVSREIDPEPLQHIAMTADGIAVVSVVGTLVARSGYLDSSSGLLAYGAVGDAIEAAMADPLVRGVILDVDSPGGEVGGLFDLVARIDALTASAGKPLWAVANEDALSAAYAIVSAADRIYVTQTGEVGSVGVVAAHVDESGADAQAGFAWSFIFAGQQKVDGNGHEPLSQRARDAIQADVDRLYGEFCTLVAANRDLTVQTVRGTQAATYRGELAIQAGLADRLGTLDLATAEMAAELDAALTYTARPKSYEGAHRWSPTKGRLKFRLQHRPSYWPWRTSSRRRTYAGARDGTASSRNPRRSRARSGRSLAHRVCRYRIACSSSGAARGHGRCR